MDERGDKRSMIRRPFRLYLIRGGQCSEGGVEGPSQSEGKDPRVTKPRGVSGLLFPRKTGSLSSRASAVVSDWTNKGTTYY